MGVQHERAHYGASTFPQVRVFDQDAAGHDLLGSCEIPLHKITSAEHAKVENETGKHAGFHKGRVFKAKAMPLVLPGNKISSTIDLELYFCPDLPQVSHKYMLELKIHSMHVLTTTLHPLPHR